MSHIPRPATLLRSCIAFGAVLFVMALGDPPGAAGAPALLPPPNDTWEHQARWEPDYGSGRDTFPVDLAGSNVEATLQPGEPTTCASIGATVWYGWQADRNGTVTVDTAGSSFNTVIAVYTIGDEQQLLPSPPGGNMVPIACDDDALGLQSRVSFSVTSGRPYWIQVGGRNGEQGDLRIHADCACSPTNDNFEFAGDLYIDEFNPEGRADIATAYATLEPGEPRPCGNIGATLWYRFYVPSNTSMIVETVGSDFDTAVAAYAVESYPPFPSGLRAVGCDDNGAGLQSRLRFEASPYDEFIIQVGGANGATGRLKLRIACDPLCPPGADNWGSYYVSPPAVAIANTTAASLEAGEPRSCGQVDKTVWYGVSISGTTRLRLSADGSDFPVALAVYDAESFSPPPASLSLIDCDTGTVQSPPSLTFEARANVTYWIQAGGVNGASGQLQVNVDCDPSPCPPYNDSMLQPAYLGAPYSFPYAESFDVRGATTEPGEDLSCGNMGHTVWIMVVPGPTLTRLRFDTLGSSHETAIALYEMPYQGAPLEQWVRTGCDAGAPDARATMEFDVRVDRTYALQIGGRNGAASDYLHVAADCLPACPPPNDSSSSAERIDGTITVSANTRGATVDPTENLSCEGMGKTVWYWIPAADAPRHVEITTNGSSFRVALALYALTGFSPPGGAELSACSASTLSFDTSPDVTYMLQVGGANDTGGDLQLNVTCMGCPAAGGGPYPVGGGGPGGVVRPPDTGNGGYLSDRVR